MGNLARAFSVDRFGERDADRELSGDGSCLASLSGRASPLLSAGGADCGLLSAKLSRPRTSLSPMGQSKSSPSKWSKGGNSNRVDNPVALRDPSASAAGFALVGLIALVPLMVALIMAISGFYLIAKKKLTAQAICIRTAVLLQQGLGRDLEELLRLNPQARRLERRRVAADRSVKAAAKTANPVLIKIALAARLAVQAEQAILRARQEAIFQRASQKRRAAKRDLTTETKPLNVRHIRAQQYFPRALAVVPLPPGSVAPEYKLAPGFTQAQQERFQFTVELAPRFLGRSFRQTTVCAVSLRKKENKWHEKIITASL